MTNSNRIKLTWISFFSYALTGALVIVTGMVMGNIADYFHLPVSSMSNTFTFLNAGILISIFLNAWLMEIVPLKTQLRFGFILMVLAVAGLMLSHSLALFSASMFVLGLVSGITMSIWDLPDHPYVLKAVSAGRVCCLPTPSLAWRA